VTAADQGLATVPGRGHAHVVIKTSVTKRIEVKVRKRREIEVVASKI